MDPSESKPLIAFLALILYERCLLSASWFPSLTRDGGAQFKDAEVAYKEMIRSIEKINTSVLQARLASRQLS